MQGESAASNTSIGDQRRRTTAPGSHLTFDGTEPQSLHDVDKDLWQQSFESVMSETHGLSPAFSLSSSQFEYCFSGSDSGPLPHPPEIEVFFNQDALNQHGFASSTEPAPTDAGLQSSPNQDVTSALLQKSSKRFPCPDCRYITDRPFNMKRHRKAVHGKC